MPGSGGKDIRLEHPEQNNAFKPGGSRGIDKSFEHSEQSNTINIGGRPGIDKSFEHPLHSNTVNIGGRIEIDNRLEHPVHSNESTLEGISERCIILGQYEQYNDIKSVISSSPVQIIHICFYFKIFKNLK